MLGKKNKPETILKRIASIKKYHENKKQNSLNGGI